MGTSAGGVPISVMVPVMSAACEMDVAAKTPIKKANEKTFTVKKFYHRRRAGQVICEIFHKLSATLL
jgi:hypothetical protein